MEKETKNTLEILLLVTLLLGVFLVVTLSMATM